MALSVSAVYECNASATAANVNGGGFNPSNANMLTDGTVDTNTGNTSAPVFSSASYNFGAGDVNNKLYIKSGTNTYPGWYTIASVASNKATLTATIGTAVVVDTTQGNPVPRYKANTNTGIASVGTPTTITFTIDYSQATAAIVNGLTDFNAVGASTTLTSATAGFTPVMVGNYFHQTTTGTGAFGVVGWYEIATYVNVTTVTLDRTPNSGTASVNTTGYVGGAMSLNSTLDDAFFELMFGTNGSGSNRVFIKNGSYTLGQAVTIAAAGGTMAPVMVEGYNSIRGDTPTGTNRPSISGGANAFTTGGQYEVYNVIFTGTAASMFVLGANGKVVNCKFTNTSTTATRIGLSMANNGSKAINNECISYRGYGLNVAGNNMLAFGNWCHDSDVGLRLAGGAQTGFLTDNIVSSNVTNAVFTAAAVTAPLSLINNTLYGAENKTSIGFSLFTGSSVIPTLNNNIFYGFTTALTATDSQLGYVSDYNDFFNNTTDVNNVAKGTNDIAVNPTFTSVSQVTGTAGAFVAGNGKLVDTTKNFTTLGVVALRDYLYIISGTGVTAGMYGISSISTTTNPNDTLNLDVNPGTSTATDKVYQITIGQNFAVGTTLKATGFPGIFPGGYTTGYVDIGAAQRQEPASSGSVGFFLQ